MNDRAGTEPVSAAGAHIGARVEYRAVAKSYGAVHALHPTSITIEPGELFSIIGPSGSGKTTMLGVTAGYVPPTSGSIVINGLDIVSVPPFKRNIGMVFQSYSLFPHMTVAENIAFPLRMRGVSRAGMTDRVKQMLAMVRLEAFGERRPIELSGGQQQRVALARAAVYSPALLLMDEPLSALDKNLREEMQYEIKQFQRTLGATVLYVTHDQGEAAAMSDRIGIMNHGRLVQIGGARELYEHPANRFVAGFLGEANILEIAETRPAAGGLVEARTKNGLTLKAAAGHGSFACVRPETIQIDGPDAPGDNRLPGVIVDTTYTAGSLRYRINLGSNTQLTARMPAERKIEAQAPGSQVAVSWRASDTLLLEDG